MSKVKSITLGLAGFAVTIASLLLLAFPVQRSLGLYGLALTQVMLLLIAVVFAVASKRPLKEIFRFKIPTGRHFFGSLLIYGGTYSFVLAVNFIQMYFFPQLTEVNKTLSDMMLSKPFVLCLFVVAVMPGICEEALHRGFILSSFSGIKSDWVKVLIMGVIFGVFHLDPPRFLTTAILGAGLTYIALKTDNLWMPVFFHFINNAFSVFALYSVGDVETGGMTLSFGIAAGYAAICTGIAVFLLYLGWKTLAERKAKSIPRAKRWTLIIVSLLMVIAGFYTAGTAILQQPVYEAGLSTDSEFSDVHHFEILVSGTYNYSLEVKNTYISVEITDSKGESVYETHFSADQATVNKPLYLERDSYTVELSLIPTEPDANFWILIK